MAAQLPENCDICIKEERSNRPSIWYRLTSRWNKEVIEGYYCKEHLWGIRVDYPDELYDYEKRYRCGWYQGNGNTIYCRNFGEYTFYLNIREDAIQKSIVTVLITFQARMPLE